MQAKKLQAAALSTQPVYIEDVFSTYLYTGNGSTQTITNGIDLAGEGGLVWGKNRSGPYATYEHWLADTARGTSKWLVSNTTGAQQSGNGITSFNSNGFSLDSEPIFNGGTGQLVSWTFRKAPKFFDVVTYTGNGVAGRTVAHNLGSVPGCIIVKDVTEARDWNVYHRSLGETQNIVLSSTAAAASSTVWNNTAPTATEFTVYAGFGANKNGNTYVAYLFAHDAGGFGEDGSENVISCGSFTGSGAGNSTTINLGYEPQFIIAKRVDAAQNWIMVDTMRGLSNTTDALLYPNLSNAESSQVNTGYFTPTATGFVYGPDNFMGDTAQIIYIAIRRGPMKTPTTGTSVFEPVTRTGTGSATTQSTSLSGVDMAFTLPRTAAGNNWLLVDRLRGGVAGSAARLQTNTTTQEFLDGPMSVMANVQNQLTYSSNAYNQSGTSYIVECFRRAPGFFDVVCYTGTGVARTVAHNLDVVPELMIVKKRSATDDWAVYANNDNTDFLLLNTTAATADDNTYWNDTSPTASVFTVGTNADVNTSAAAYVAYLFATLPGVSKVGSYTGNGTSQTIDCGFTTGARFVLIKRTDNTGDWYVWDSARGIVAGNDPHLSLNTTAAEVTTDDSVDADTSGFIVNQDAATNVNVNSASYIFLAIA